MTRLKSIIIKIQFLNPKAGLHRKWESNVMSHRQCDKWIKLVYVIILSPMMTLGSGAHRIKTSTRAIHGMYFLT